MQIYELEKRLTMDVKHLAKMHNIKMENIYINIQTNKGCYGVYSPNRWKNGESFVDEISLNPEHFDRDFELVDTMLHELVHVYCRQNGIKDTSRAGYYHNAKFKKVAEQFGLKCVECKKVGWNTTAEGNEEFLKELNQTLPYPVNSEMIRRSDSAKKGPTIRTKPRNHVYTCPLCDMTIKHKDLIYIQCMKCHCWVELDEDDEKKGEWDEMMEDNYGRRWDEE